MTVRLIFVFALSVRGAALAYTLAANPNPVWPAETHSQLAAALGILNGASTPPAYIDDIGLRYVHVLLSPFGGPSLFRLQAFQILIDALMTLVAWRIGQQFGGLSVARVSGCLYALFLPQVMLAVVPSYDVWATWALLLPTWLVLEGVKEDKKAEPFGVLAGGSAALLSIVRSSTIFYGFAVGVVLLTLRRRKLAVFTLAGWVLIALPLSVYKYQTQGELAPMRSNVPHMFWVGVGQFPNAYGVEPTDESVNALYTKWTGKKDYNSAESEAFLVLAAADYLREHPLAFLWAAARRSVMIVFPKNYWGPWADVWHPQFIQALLLLHESPFQFVRRRPLMAALGVLGRIVDWLILPSGALVGAIVLWNRNRRRLVTALPLLYTILTLAALYVTPRNTTNAYAATLPLCALGICTLINSRHDQANLRWTRGVTSQRRDLA